MVKKNSIEEIKEVKIKLNALIRAKNDLEQSLKDDEKNIRRYNSILKEENCPIDMIETIRLYLLKLDQLLHFKEAIRNGNNKQMKDDGKTNDHYIYLLSNFNRRKALLRSLNTFEGSRPSFKDTSKKVTYVAQIKFQRIQEELTEIDSEVRKIESILADFNHTIEVEVLIYTELSLL
jgi:hypothetical protein